MLAIKLCSMFRSRGHIVYFYGIEDAEVSASKIVDVIAKNDYDEVSRVSNDFKDPRYMTGLPVLSEGKQKIIDNFAKNLQIKLHAYYTPGDVVLHIADCIPEDHYFKKMIHIEALAMGGNIYNSNVIFITEPYRQYQYKKYETLIKNSTVILPWFNPNDYKIGKKKDDTYLYLARCGKCKGLDTYLNISKEFPDRKFLIAGGVVEYNKKRNIIVDDENNKIHLNDYPNVKYMGIVDAKQRKILLSRVSLLIQPTKYFEPCGWNVIEAMLSGTPVIVPLKGGFCQTVIHGATGFFCNVYQDYITYLERRSYKTLIPEHIRDYAITN
ncbi:MAG: glycosyltransferase, partial [Romboutsia sp.]|nr:glycosyltransferase [Romboutsia sp.]